MTEGLWDVVFDTAYISDAEFLPNTAREKLGGLQERLRRQVTAIEGTLEQVRQVMYEHREPADRAAKEGSKYWELFIGLDGYSMEEEDDNGKH